VLAFITRHAAGLFDAPATSVMLWDARGQALVISGEYGLSEPYTRSLRIPRARVEATLASHGPHPLIVLDLQETPFADGSLVAAEGLRTDLIAPLVAADGDLMGVLNIYSGTCRELRLEKRSGMIYANQIAIALENARWFEEARQRSRHWEALYASGKAISAGFSAERRPVLDRIVEEAVESIAALSGPRPTSGILQLYTAETNTLAFESVYPAALWSTLRAQVGDSRPLDRATVPAGASGSPARCAGRAGAARVT
jgi:GAF domain-containing protein